MKNEDVLGVIWWSCFLDSSDPIYEHISAIGEALKQRGQLLVVLGPAGDYSRFSGFIQITVQFSLVEQGRTLKHILGPSKSPMSATAVPELMDAEQHWFGIPETPETEFMILRALRFWERAFEIMRPSVILSWGSTLPFSRLLLRLAQMTQTPGYVMERGLTENTLMMNLQGQCQISNIGLRLPFIDPVLPQDEVDKEWEVIERYYRSLTERNYASANKQNSVGSIFDKSAPKGPTILFLGAFDTGSGISFNNLRAGDRLGGWIHSSEQAARAVAQSLARLLPEATLIVKPHPATSFSLDDNYGGVQIHQFPEVDFRELLSVSDICVTPISTTQIYGFIYDKPVVTLANSFFTGRHIAYEAQDRKSLDEALSAAIQRSGWQERRSLAKALIVALFREEFIGLTDDVPGRLKSVHLVEHLARFVNYRDPDSQPASVRMDQFDAFHAFAAGQPNRWSWQTLGIAIGQEQGVLLSEEIQQAMAVAVIDALDREGEPAESDSPTLVGMVTEIIRQRDEHAHSQSRVMLQELETANIQLKQSLEDQMACRQQCDELRRERHLLLSERDALTAAFVAERASFNALVEEGAAEIARLNAVAREIDSCRQEINGLNESLEGERSRGNILESRLMGSMADIDIVSGWFKADLDRRLKKRKSSLLDRLHISSKSALPAGFDPMRYLLLNPDVANSGMAPDHHWERFGKNEGRRWAARDKI